MSGPFETERQAIDSVRHILNSPPGTAWTDGNRRLLTDALADAGVAVGAYDSRIMHWLADGGEPQTLAVIAGWVARANRAPGSIVLTLKQAETAFQALDDAKWDRVGRSTDCAACDAIDRETRGEREQCDQHAPDMEQAERYDQLLHWLADAAGVPEAAEMEVRDDRRRAE